MDWIHHDCNNDSSSWSPSKNGVPISQAVADWHLLEVRGWWAWSWGQECWMLVRVMIIMIMWTMIILMMIKKRQMIQSDNYQVGPDHMHHALRHHRSDHHWSLADCRFGEIDWDLALEIYCHQNCSYIYIRLLLLSIVIFLRDQVFHRSLQQGQLLDSSTKSGCESKKTYHWKCIRTKSEEYNEFDITLNRDIKEQLYHKKNFQTCDFGLYWFSLVLIILGWIFIVLCIVFGILWRWQRDTYFHSTMLMFVATFCLVGW